MAEALGDFRRATQATSREMRAVIAVCEWNLTEALDLFSLSPRVVWTALPKRLLPVLGRFPLDVRKKILKDFVPFFRCNVFEAWLVEHYADDYENLSTIVLRAFANSNKDVYYREQFAQILQIGETDVLPVFQEWTKELKEMEKAAKDSVELEAARERLKLLLNHTLPNVVETNPVFCGIVEDVVNLRVRLSDGVERSALHVAAKLGDTELVNNLLERNANWIIQDGCGYTALHAGVNHPNIVKALLNAVERTQQLDRFILECNNEHETALHLCRNGESARLLLQASAALLFLMDREGATALYSSVDSAEMVKVLLNAAKEADKLVSFVEHLDNEGRTALHFCQNVESAQLLLFVSPSLESIQCKAGNTPLHMQIMYGKKDMCRLLIEEYRADVNVANAQGQTPLHLACHFRQTEIVALLLEKAARVLVRDKDSLTVLHYIMTDVAHDEILDCSSRKSFEFGNLEEMPLILDLLLTQSERVVAELVAAGDAHGWNAFHYFAAFGFGGVALADKLMLAGMDGAARGANGHTALHILADMSFVDLALHLIKLWGLSVNVKNYAGETALVLVNDLQQREALRRASVLANIVTLRLAARPRAVQSPWKRLPRELFRELCCCFT